MPAQIVHAQAMQTDQQAPLRPLDDVADHLAIQIKALTAMAKRHRNGQWIVAGLQMITQHAIEHRQKSAPAEARTTSASIAARSVRRRNRPCHRPVRVNAMNRTVDQPGNTPGLPTRRSPDRGRYPGNGVMQMLDQPGRPNHAIQRQAAQSMQVGRVKMGRLGHGGLRQYCPHCDPKCACMVSRNL